MSKIDRCKPACIISLLIISLILSFSRTWAQPVWDSQRYIDVDEIQPGAEAVCRTCYRGTTIEEFPLTVISVVRDIEPGLDAILVEGLDDRFKHTGPVAGCSGSPVYIEGRMAGALAFGWPYSKDPLYGVTPIRSMLAIETSSPAVQGQVTSMHGFEWDATEPLDIQAVVHAYQETVQSLAVPRQSSMALFVSGVPATGQPWLTNNLSAFGLVPMAGGGAGVGEDVGSVEMTPGASLVVPLMQGDIRLAAVGTATEVRDGQVYGFGHAFLGYGNVDLPMATGYVHTIVSNLSRSFKLASALQPVGALIYDTPVGIVGQLGREAPMIDLDLTLDHFMQPGQRHYQCRMTADPLLGPTLFQSALGSVMESMGGYPPHHVLNYKVEFDVVGHEDIVFENLSIDMGLNELLNEVMSVMLMLETNPYEAIKIESVSLEAHLHPTQKLAYLVGLEIDDKTVEPGQDLNVRATLEADQGGRHQTEFTLTLPRDSKEGELAVSVCGPYEYQQFLRRSAPQRLTALDGKSLVTALKLCLEYPQGSPVLCVGVAEQWFDCRNP